VDIGFDPQRLFLAQLNLTSAGYGETRGRAFYDDILKRVRNLPEVDSATIADTLPPGWVWGGTVEIEGRLLRKGEPGFPVGSNIVGPDFFQTLRIPVLAGRAFQTGDVANAPRVVVVNETMARRFWPDDSPIGKRLRWTHGFTPEPYMQVVGVVRDGKYGALEEKTGPFVYVPFSQRFSADMKLVVRGRADTGAAIAAVRRETLAFAPDLPDPTFDTMDQHISEHLVNQRMVAVSTGIFGLIALALAAVGLYAVIAWSVAQRTREIGVRLALGAQPSNVMRLMLWDGLPVLAIGLGAGVLLSLAVTRLFIDWLFGVAPADPSQLLGGWHSRVHCHAAGDVDSGTACPSCRSGPCSPLGMSAHLR
jgi:predicted permease